MSNKKLRLIAKKVVFFGTKYKCTICGSHIRKFLPHGISIPVLSEKRIVGGYNREKTGKCPVCRRIDRERLIYKYVFNSGKINLRGISVLHVAPELPIANKFKEIKEAQKINYQAGDKFEAGYVYDCEELDITKTKYEDNTFDLLICNHVLEHIPNDGDAMREIFRILKPGGKAILQVPISLVLDETYEDLSIVDPKEREIKFGQYDHVRIYGQDYPKRLNSVGFNTEIVNPVDLWGAKTLVHEGINPEEKLYIAVKP
jgi:predicted SAM-dependent methyltransferase